MKVSAYIEPCRMAEAKEFCRKHGYDPIFFEENETCKGKAFSYAMATALSKVVEGLLVYSADDMKELVSIKDRLAKEGKKLISIVEPRLGKSSLVLHPTFLKQQQTGKPFKGPMLYGYDVVSGILTLNLVEQTIIQEMRKRKAQGLTYFELAHEMNTKGYRNKRNGIWSSGSVLAALRGDQ